MHTQIDRSFENRRLNANRLYIYVHSQTNVYLPNSWKIKVIGRTITTTATTTTTPTTGTTTTTTRLLIGQFESKKKKEEEITKKNKNKN